MKTLTPTTAEVHDMGNGLVMVAKTACWVSDMIRCHEVERIVDGRLETHRVYVRGGRATCCSCREHSRYRRKCVDMAAVTEFLKGW
jgi:hypothetical protein